MKVFFCIKSGGIRPCYLLVKKNGYKLFQTHIIFTDSVTLDLHNSFKISHLIDHLFSLSNSAEETWLKLQKDSNSADLPWGQHISSIP